MKPKIYFAKTNGCSKNDVITVRNCLYEMDVQVLEYSISSTHREESQKIAESDFIVVLTQDCDGGVGKGVYSQVELFLENHKKEDVYIVTDVSDGEFYVDSLDSIERCSGDDWISYGWLETRGIGYIDIHELSARFKPAKIKVKKPTVTFKKGDKVTYKFNPDTFYPATEDYAKCEGTVAGTVYTIKDVSTTDATNKVYIKVKSYHLAADCFEPVVATKNEPVKREDVDKLLRFLDDSESEKTAVRKAIYDVEVSANPCGEIWRDAVQGLTFKADFFVPETESNMMMLLIG